MHLLIKIKNKIIKTKLIIAGYKCFISETLKNPIKLYTHMHSFSDVFFNTLANGTTPLCVCVITRHVLKFCHEMNGSNFYMFEL